MVDLPEGFLRLGSTTVRLPSIEVILTCEQDHEERGFMTVLLDYETGYYNCTGGSSWDFCEQCGVECGTRCDLGEDGLVDERCCHGGRSDDSREAGHRLVEVEVDRAVEEAEEFMAAQL